MGAVEEAVHLCERGFSVQLRVIQGGDLITNQEVVEIAEANLLPIVSELYELEGYDMRPVQAHRGGRNVVYTCEKAGTEAKMLRIAFLPDRTREEALGEVEYIRYLHEHGGPVPNVIRSKNGNLLEEIAHHERVYRICLFERAKGIKLADNRYRYREGVPITEYYYNCGKVLGNLHRLSKGYTPVHRRRHFLGIYNAAYLDDLIPNSLARLKAKLTELIAALAGLDSGHDAYGMIHFDFNDGNYHVDYDSGRITLYDFDNSCFGWYLYDLADLWRSGLGWVASEPDAVKRRSFMDDYFNTAIAGYRSETEVEQSTLDKLPLFINVTLMENIVDTFECMWRNGEEPACDEALSYLIKCLEDDIPYMGFFHDIYASDEPFEYEIRRL
ncbi:phosphotransferase enzyme family protein [Paenibacillus methanolicus]|uniref:Phosphotransferase family enzyme n=1 Tax=Paenibacillus methanolicus TaxID=582686 RepID=A0A5S5CHR0_9BACL|nr:phosphotransferase [Paenibacillus methanolicus]TYP79300.1 phosphotransferase family enzyme [Paenibacillus methanolicus]